MPDAAALIRASEIVPPAISLVLALLVVGHAIAVRRPAREALGWVSVVLVLLGFTPVLPASAWFFTFPLLVSVFPDGRFVPRWFVVPVSACFVLATGEILSDGAWSEHPLWSGVGAGQMVLLLAQVHRYRRRSTTRERQAVRWVILGTLLTVACFAAVAAAYGTIGEGPAGSVVGARLAVLPLAVCLVGAVVNPVGLDVDRALHTTVLVLLVVPVLAGAYAVVDGWHGPGAGAAAVGVGAVPVLALGRRLADWLVYRGRPSAGTAVTDMLRRLGERADRDSVPAIVLDAATRAIHLDGGTITGSWFEPVGDLTGSDFALTYRGERLAVLSLPHRRGETTFTARDRRVIEALGVHAAPALHGDRALAELAESRQRVVAAREEERRRLRRDLHDHLGPTLSGLSLSAAALARRTGLPEATELHEDIKEVVAQSREISYGLRPPVLDDHGLVAAIRHRTSAHDDLEVRVVATDPLVLPAAVDLAALTIVGEAVSNVRRHAEASSVEVSLHADADHLHVTVADDGVGLPPDVRPGIGMHSIAERAAEVGGTARYDRTSAGTRLDVVLPLEAS